MSMDPLTADQVSDVNRFRALAESGGTNLVQVSKESLGRLVEMLYDFAADQCCEDCQRLFAADQLTDDGYATKRCPICHEEHEVRRSERNYEALQERQP